MKALQQRRIACFVLVVIMLLNVLPIHVHAAKGTQKDKALAWLQNTCSDNQEWVDAELPNLTCNVLVLLKHECVEANSTFLTDWEKKKNAFNVDELAHLTWEKADENVLLCCGNTRMKMVVSD